MLISKEMQYFYFWRTDTISTISESQKLKPPDKNFHLIFFKSVLKLKLKLHTVADVEKRQPIYNVGGDVD